jgi:hypothetical protein
MLKREIKYYQTFVVSSPESDSCMILSLSFAVKKNQGRKKKKKKKKNNKKRDFMKY